jgi:16S rRNA processing protein RimM
MTEAAGDTDHVIVGEIVKVRGIQGEVLVRPFSDVPGRFDDLDGAFLIEPDGGAAFLAIESVRRLQGEFIVRFRGIDDRQAAKERLVGRALAVSRARVPPAGADESYYFELVGLEVVRTDGIVVGRLASILETGANDVYVVDGPGGEVLIPATREVVVQVDVAAGRMTVRPAPGLFDSGPGAAGDASAGAAGDSNAGAAEAAP